MLTEGDDLGQAYEEAKVDRGQLLDRPFVPERQPTKKQSIPDQLARPLCFDGRSGCGSRRGLVGRRVASDGRLARVLSPCWRRQRQTPLWLTMITSQRGCRSWVAIRSGS